MALGDAACPLFATPSVGFAYRMKGTLYINASTTTETVGALKFGTFGSPQVYTTDEVFEIHGRLGSGTESKPLLRVRNSAYADGAMTTGQVVAIQSLAYGTSTNNVYELQAVQGHCGIKGASSLLASGHMRAAYFKVEDLGHDLTAASGSFICPLWMEMQFSSGSTFNGNVYWINFSKYGSETSLYGDAVFRFEDSSGGGWATNLFEFQYQRAPLDATAHGSGEAGRIKVKHGSTTCYLHLFTNT